MTRIAHHADPASNADHGPAVAHPGLRQMIWILTVLFLALGFAAAAHPAHAAGQQIQLGLQSMPAFWHPLAAQVGVRVQSEVKETWGVAGGIQASPLLAASGYPLVNADLAVTKALKGIGSSLFHPRAGVAVTYAGGDDVIDGGWAAGVHLGLGLQVSRRVTLDVSANSIFGLAGLSFGVYLTPGGSK
jgi:hypothetical protein